MSNAQRKRAAEPPENEPGKKRGRPSQAVLDSKVPEDSMSRSQAREMLERHPPLVNPKEHEEASFYDKLVPWPEEYQWSDEDHAAVAKEWMQSEIKKECSKSMNTSQFASLFLLFKISLRLYRTTPIALLSPVYDLRYQAVSKVANKWIMSAGFCDTLSSIMVHPCWEENIDSLALALGWAVICRLDSRQLWEISMKISCPVIQRTFQEVEGYGAKSSDTSYHDLHKAQRERASDRGDSLSTLSDILYEIGEAVPKEPKMPEADPEYDHLFGEDVLPVTPWDLKVLVTVVNSMNFKPQWKYSTQEALEAWKIENSGPEVPSKGKLAVIYKYVHLSIFRHLRLLNRQFASEQDAEEAGDDESQCPDPTPSSDDNGSQINGSSPHHHSCPPDAVEDSSGQESESLNRRPRHRPQRLVRDDEEEDGSPVRRNNFDLPLNPLPDAESGDYADEMTNILDDGSNLYSGEFIPQATDETEEFRPYGPTLTESFPAGPPASPIYASVREKKMLSEISELRKENKELRDGQKQMQRLFVKNQKEQKQQMLDVMQKLNNVESQLTQLLQSKEASNEGAVVQSHSERAPLPEATVIAPKSPGLGTNPSVPRNDARVLQETIDDEPMDDITPEHRVPKQRTPEPERSEPQATVAPEVIRSAPQQNTSKQKTPEPEQSQRQDEPVEIQHHEQLSDQNGQALAPRTGVKVSSQNLRKDTLHGLAKRPVKKERRIGSMTGLLSGHTSRGSAQREIFVTPRSEILKTMKQIE
ncbi:hypothetical protein F52700_2484 [Fusarium sp. NRRL 52700]|nr:hypothetical protein F52700_2484 [Fusarium sp. NRRL 52700]